MKLTQPNLTLKVKLFFLTVVIGILLFPTAAWAQSVWEVVKGDANISTWLGNVAIGAVGDMGARIACDKTFDEIISDAEGCGITEVALTPGQLSPGGLTGSIARAFDEIPQSRPPVNLAVYFQDLKQHSPFASSAYAQSPLESTIFTMVVLENWKTFRNMAYALMIPILVVTGFMIMFRRQIAPQTVVTIQYALPRIAIALILITFSYAIVGLVLSMILPLISVAFRINLGIFGNQITSFVEMSNNIIDLIARVFVHLQGLSFGIVGAAGVLMAMFPIFMGIMYFQYIKRYVNTILLTMFAPFIILMAAIPGNEAGIWNWFKKIIANALAIPAMVFVFLLGIGIIGGSGFTAAATIQKLPIYGTLEFLGISTLLETSAVIQQIFLGMTIAWQAKNVYKYIEAGFKIEPMIPTGKRR